MSNRFSTGNVNRRNYSQAANGGSNDSEEVPPAQAESSGVLGAASQLSGEQREVNTRETVGLEDNPAAGPTDFDEMSSSLEEENAREGARIIRESFEATAEDIRTASYLFTFYNTRASLINLEQSESLILLENSLSLSSLREDFNQNISLLSHENYKITAQPIGPIFGPREMISNGPFINPEQLFLLKSNYINNKVNSIKNRYFNKNSYSEDNKNLYLNSIKENNVFKKDYMENIESFLDNNKSNLKKINFGNQVIEYAESNNYLNYFGKVSSVIYKVSKQSHSIDPATTHSNGDYLRLNSLIESESSTNSKRYDNLKSVFTNYFKFRIEDNDDVTSGLSSNQSEIIDSNILISKALLNCSLSLKNIHEGSFTNTGYNKESDLNYEIYDSLLNNNSLNRMSILPYAYHYDVLNNTDEYELNFTNPSYTNEISGGKLINEVNSIDFNEDSIYNLSDVYDNDKIHKDHFTSISMLQRSNNMSNTDFYSFYPDGNREDIFSLSLRIKSNHSWIDFEDHPATEPASDSDFISHDEFEQKYDITVDDYLCQRNNLLDVDAIIFNRTGKLQLIYVDNESQIRDTDGSDSNRIKYLSSPTFNLFSIHDAGHGLASINSIEWDMSFNESFGWPHQPIHNSVSWGSFSKSTFFRRTRALAHRNSVIKASTVSREIPIDFLRIKTKLFSELSPDRLLYAYTDLNNQVEGQIDNVFNGVSGNLSSFIDRVWTISSEGNVDTEHNTIQGSNNRYLRSIDFRKVRMGAGERFVQLGIEKSAIVEEEKIPSILDKKFYPFVMVENTNKLYDYNSDVLKEKFLKDEGSEITTEEEEFYKRVSLTSSSRMSYKKDSEKNTFKTFNTKSSWGLGKNDWVNSSFEIKRNLFKLKEKKLEENQFFNFLKSVSLKSNAVVVKGGSNAFSFLHSNDEVSKMFSLEESPFLYKKNNSFIDINNYKSNYSKEIININNALNLLSSADIEGMSSFSDKDSLNSFLDLYYTNSYLKNSSSLIYKFFYDINKTLKKYTNEYVKDNKNKIGFEKLVADSLTSNNEALKYFIYSTIEIKHKGIEYKNRILNPESFFKNIDKESAGLYNSYLTSVFSYENVKKQNTFTLRTIDSSFLTGISISDTRGNSLQHNINQVSEMGFVELSAGKIKNYLFPHSTHTTKLSTGHLNILSEDKDEGELRISGFKKDLGLFFTLNTYNYDAYLHKGNNKNIDNKSLFSKENIQNSSLNANISYIVLPVEPKAGYTDDYFQEEHQGQDQAEPDRKIKDFVRNVGFRTAQVDKDLTAEDVYDRISNNLFYETLDTVTFDKDLTYELMLEENTFTNNLSNIILSFVTYMFSVEELESQSTLELLNSNKEEIKTLSNICREFIKMYVFEYERISTLSLHRSIELEVQVSNNDNDVNELYNFWDDNIKNKIEASYAKILHKIDRNDIDYDINSVKNTFEDERSVYNQYHKSKQSTDNFNIINLLNKSDYLESVSFDLIFAYLSNFEDNKNMLLSQSESRFNVTQKISSMSNDINDIENINFTNIASNKYKICKISKLMQNEKFYSLLKEENIDSSSFIRGDLDFKSLDIFKSDVKREEDKRNLAEIGLETFLLDDGLQENFNKIDILRFGIPYNLANSLGNDKIMSIMVYPVNHKYPEIEFEPFEFLYTPVLTDITEHFNNTTSIASLKDYLGVYDIFNQDFSKKYKILNTNGLINVVFNMLTNISNKRQVMGFDDTLSPDAFNFNRIIIARKLSNSIKYLNESYNSVFDDAKINKLNIDFDNIISLKTKAEFDKIDLDNYKKIFSENKSIVEEYFVEEDGYISIEDKKEQVTNNIHSIEFFNKIDNDISNVKFLKSLTTDAFFDIFSVRISKEALREKIITDLSDSMKRHILQDKDDFSNSYSYTIQTKVY